MSSILLESTFLEKIESSKIPYMLFNRRTNKGGNYIVFDNILAGRLITNYLLELNHKSIAYISGPLNVSTFIERKTGYEEAIQLEKEIYTAMYITDGSANDVESQTLKAIKEHKLDSIIFATDAMAFVGMHAILSLDINIPKDISIVGIDNNNLSSHNSIQLTSVGNKGVDMGVLAIETLIDIINNKSLDKKNKQLILEPELKIRKTTIQR